MPESYVCLPFMKTDPEDRERWKIENAERQLNHIINIIKDCKRGIEELEKGSHSPTLLIRYWCLLQCTNGYRQEIHGRSGCMYPVRQVRENMPCGQHKRYTAEMDS